MRPRQSHHDNKYKDKVYLLYFAAGLTESPVVFWQRNLVDGTKILNQQLYHAAGSIKELDQRTNLSPHFGPQGFSQGGEYPNYPHQVLTNQSGSLRLLQEQCVVCESEEEFKNIQTTLCNYIDDQDKKLNSLAYPRQFFCARINQPPVEFRQCYLKKNRSKVSQYIVQVGKKSIVKGTPSPWQWEPFDNKQKKYEQKNSVKQATALVKEKQLIELTVKKDRESDDKQVLIKIADALISSVSYEFFNEAVILPEGQTFSREELINQDNIQRIPNNPNTNTPFIISQIKPNELANQLIFIFKNAQVNDPDEIKHLDLEAAKQIYDSVKKLVCRLDPNNISVDGYPNLVAKEIVNLIKQHETLMPKTFLIPVSGRIGRHVKHCHITVKNFDKKLIIDDVKEENGMITLNVSASKTIERLEALGLTSIHEGNRYNYKISIQKDIAKQVIGPKEPSIPLFGLRIVVNSQSTFLDAAHMFTKEEIRYFREQIKKKKIEISNASTVTPTNSSQEDPVLKAIREVNQYLKKRAGETSGFFVSLSDFYTGKDYYLRRDSWKKILKKMNAHNPSPESKNELLKLIREEANKFKPSFFSIFQRHEYYTSLMNLDTAISTINNYNFSSIAEPVATYYKIYEEMDIYKSVVEKYTDNYSFFKFSIEKKYENSVCLERELYHTHYDMLSETDKKNFLNPEEEHLSEYNNVLRSKTL